MAKFDDQLDLFRTEEFWDRVMQELAGFLAPQGPLTPIDILPDLRSVTMGGATLHKEPLTPATLKPKGERKHVFGHVDRYTPDGHVSA
ncbi:hypothetical protein ACQKQD_29555 [Methylobacterium sp. NPDC080182]|uniref:hypothetical protein n=1 Tax=Methylobacterium sp. NPDC080182 TaxID=3390590 RepID=UPI003D0785B7